MTKCDSCYKDVKITHNVEYYGRHVDLCDNCMDFFRLWSRVGKCTCGADATNQPGHSWYCDKE